MTRSEAVAAVDQLIAHLEADVARAQTRDQHLTLSMRLSEARALKTGLTTAPATV